MLAETLFLLSWSPTNASAGPSSSLWGELELFPCPPSLQAYSVLDEGAAGLDES